MNAIIERNYIHEHRDNSGRKYTYNFDEILRHYMMESFAPFMKQGKALEMGCHKGDVTELLAGHYDDMTVIEAAEDMVQICQNRINKKIKFVTSTFEKYDTDEKYDAIFLIHTLEHLDHPVEILKKVNHWLADDGYLFLVVPNANAPSRQIAVKMGLITHHAAVTQAEFEHGHRCTYSLDTLERDAVAAGLKPVHRSGIFFKALANFQFDALMQTEIISKEYMDGCYKLGMIYPDLCASIFLLCEKGDLA